MTRNNPCFLWNKKNKNINHLEQGFTKMCPAFKRLIQLIKQSVRRAVADLFRAETRQQSCVTEKCAFTSLVNFNAVINTLSLHCRVKLIWLQIHARFSLRSFTGVRAPVSKVDWWKRCFTVIQVRSSVRTKVNTEPAWTCSTGSLPSLDLFINTWPAEPVTY